MRGPHDGADDSADEDDKALLYVHGAVALDMQARATIRAALKQAGICIVHEQLLAANTSLSADPASKCVCIHAAT